MYEFFRDWFLVAIAIMLGMTLAELARAQTPVTIVACDQAHDTCRYSTTAVQDSSVQACLDLNAPGWSVDTDCGGAYASCWNYGIGRTGNCAVLPNLPVSESDPCYAGCFGAEATACGRTIDIDCVTCQPAWGPSSPRCQVCERVVEVCFLENLPTDPADPNYPGEGGYNPDDPTDPDCFGSADCKDEPPPFTGCDSNVQECACDYENGGFSFDQGIGTCSGDFNGDGDADRNEVVNKKCDDEGNCRCPDGTVEEGIGNGNGCRVTNECSYYADLYGEAANCGCGDLLLYEGQCVRGCPAGSTLNGGQCVPDNDDTPDDPFVDVVELEGTLCNVDFVWGDDYEWVGDFWAAAVAPPCVRYITAVQRVFSPTFVAGDECPFDFAGLEFTWLGTDLPAYQSSEGGFVCSALENHRGNVSLVLGWVYLLIAVRSLLRSA